MHSTGGLDTKAEYIRKTLTIDTPAAVPGLDQTRLDVYGDVAVRTARARTRDGRFLWWTYVYVRRDGRWQIVRGQGTAVPPEPARFAIDPRLYDAYTGRYQDASGAVLVVTRDGDTLHAQGTGRARVTLVPESETRFHIQDAPSVTVTFVRHADGSVTQVIRRRAAGHEDVLTQIR